jgi:hypothetical protein
MRAHHAAIGLAALVLCSGCGQPPQPTPTATPSEEALPVLFDDSSLSFTHPAAWRDATFDVTPSFNFTWLVFLSTDAMRNPCTRDGNGQRCNAYPVDSLSPNGVIINWSHWGFLGWELDPSKGPVINVGGRRATVDRRGVRPGCRAIGGEEEIVVQVEGPGATSNWFEMSACLSGPDLAPAHAAIDAMLASVRWQD